MTILNPQILLILTGSQAEKTVRVPSIQNNQVRRPSHIIWAVGEESSRNPGSNVKGKEI